jgi:quercetin dioxygenase-like cupin family protein
MAKEYFGDFNTLKSIFIENPAMDRQIFYGDKIMLGRNIIKAGTTVPMHSHPEEQISYVISGECDVIIEGEEPRHCKAGAVAWFPANKGHEVIVGDEDTEILDIFNPVREDWLELFGEK